MYSDTITLFNFYKSSSGDMWYPTVIEGVNLIVDKAAIVAKFGAESKDNAILNIHYNTLDGHIMIAEKLYFPPKEWRRQSDDKLPQSITFSSGTEFDFFMLGDYGSAEPIADNDFKGFFSHIKNKYDYVFAITSVTKYGAIPHFEIMGK